MAKSKGSITFNKIDKNTEALLLKAITAAPSYAARLKARLEKQVLPQVSAEATRHYQGAVAAIDSILQSGVDGAESAKTSISFTNVDGEQESVTTSWNPLAPSTLARKAATNRGLRGGKAKRSLGAGKFWLDRGQLRSAYARLAARQTKVVAKLVRVRGDNGRFTFDVALELSKLPQIYLNDAIRRSLIEGIEGVDSQHLAAMSGPPTTSKPSGLMRGFWAEAYRPLMRPVSRRLGRTMRKSVIQSFKRRR